MPAAMSVKLRGTTVEALRVEAKTMHRSITGQAEHWIEIGQAMEQQAASPLSNRVRMALSGQLDQEELNDDEMDAFIDAFSTGPMAGFEQHMSEIGKKRSLVGVDEFDRYVRRHPNGDIEVLSEDA